MSSDAAIAFDRPTDGHGHRPRWTADEIDAHRGLEEAFREWSANHGVIWFDTDTRLAERIADALGITIDWSDRG